MLIDNVALMQKLCDSSFVMCDVALHCNDGVNEICIVQINYLCRFRIYNVMRLHDGQLTASLKFKSRIG